MKYNIKKLLDSGFLIEENTKNMIKKLSEGELQKLINFMEKENILLVSDDIIKKTLATEIEVLREFEPEKKFTIQDFVKMFNNRYNFLKDILIKKLELSKIVSINKCGVGKTTVIGLVKTKEEKNENYIVSLEDSTGEIETIIPKKLGEKISLDDVVAISGNINNKILFADKIIYPDVPLKPVNYSSKPIKIAFLTKKKDTDVDYLIYDNKIEDKLKNKRYEIKKPSLIKIGAVLILIIHDSDPLEVLKKRYIHKKNNDFFIEPSPDIVFSNKNIDTNYKGISVVSKNKTIDLKTRKVINV